jgi:hypothetical protein
VDFDFGYVEMENVGIAIMTVTVGLFGGFLLITLFWQKNV